MSTIQFPGVSYLSRLAMRAGDIMLREFKLGMSRPCKDDNTPVTEADTAINQMVINAVTQDYPYVEVLGEEGSHHLDKAEHRIIFDPVDGTIPFSRGVPVSTFCISVLRGDEPLVAVIHDPFMNRTWLAEKGGGAWMNNRGSDSAIRVSGHAELLRSNISMIWWTKSDYNLQCVSQKLMNEKALWVNLASVAIFGGLIGSGEFDASIFPGRRSLETPAMQLIVEEAGGRATDIHGNKLHYGPKCETEGHIISNGVIHDKLVEIVASCQ